MGNGGGKSRDLKLFTYASIVSATRNFSSNNKLGEGGFGPVYKVNGSEFSNILATQHILIFNGVFPLYTSYFFAGKNSRWPKYSSESSFTTIRTRNR